VTACLARVPDPLEFGIVIQTEDGRIERFLEKPTWGQVFSDTVNTGIYVMEPEVFDHVEQGVAVDWSGDVFPRLLELGAPLYGHVADGYWEDVGNLDSYRRVQADVLHRRVDVQVDGFEVSPGVWVGEGVDIDPDAQLTGPLCIGDHVKVEGGVQLGELCVLGNNVVVKGGASCSARSSTTTSSSARRSACAARSSARTPTSCGPRGSARARWSATSASWRRRRTSPTG
jgi:mannose-1-phosphate guanylyltransferase/phosphomannomutase